MPVSGLLLPLGPSAERLDDAEQGLAILAQDKGKAVFGPMRGFWPKGV